MLGRLGNQLFQYAFVRALQTKFYPDYRIEINLQRYTIIPEEKKQKGDEDFLKYFQVNALSYSDKEDRDLKTFFQRCFTGVRGRILAKIFSRKVVRYLDIKFLQHIFNIVGLYMPLSPSGYIKPLRSFSKNIFCCSCFENARYFDEIKNILLEEIQIQPQYEVLPHNIELLNDIKNSDSVCVHIRRGDFLLPIYAEFNVCNEEYFITAMKKIRAEIPECKFFVFSDDVDDVKKNFHFPFEVTYEQGNSPAYETLRLMYNCKHFIISNSTFSWWAQYLSRNENKIVYAPTPWHWNSEKWEGLYLPYMRTIECHK